MGSRNLFLGFISFCLFVFVLKAAKAFIIPLVLALLVWYLIKILADFFVKAKLGFPVPKVAAYGISVAIIIGILFFFVDIISTNVTKVVRTAPSYEENLNRIIAQATTQLNLTLPFKPSRLVEDFNFTRMVTEVAGAAAGVIGNLGMMLMYLVFLFVEQQFFQQKLERMVSDPKKRRSMFAILGRIDQDIRKYIGLKMLVSLITALLSYVVMVYIKLDFADFWAIIIFTLNFIPNVGSLVATALPCMLALVQFEDKGPFFIALTAITSIQLAVANLLEPRIMGKSLNLSPLVIIVSLVAWANIWGVLGMFLCVPIMAVAVIVFSHFEVTRPLAVMLSSRGEIESSSDKEPLPTREPEQPPPV